MMEIGAGHVPSSSKSRYNYFIRLKVFGDRKLVIRQIIREIDNVESLTHFAICAVS